MSKYSEEFKLKVVNYYLNNHYGWEYVARQFDIPAWTTVRKWVRKYEEHGKQGLIKNKKSSYSGEFKQNVVEYMHTNHLSCQQTAYHFNLGDTYVVGKWERIYYEEGPQALYKERRGRKNVMDSKPRKKKSSKEVEEDLVAENQRLRMENAYLKKLQALVQERTKPKHPKK
jgi:transposase